MYLSNWNSIRVCATVTALQMFGGSLSGQTPAAAPAPKPAATAPAKPPAVPPPAAAPAAKSTPTQAPAPAPTVARPPSAKTAAPSMVDSVLRMIKLKLPDATILRSVQPMLKGNSLKPEDLIRLAENGASPSLIESLMGSGEAATAARAPVAPGKVSSPVPAPPPSIPSGLASVLTDFSTLQCDVPVAARKRVIAVDEFDFGAQKNTEQAILKTQSAIGVGMTALSVKRIQEAGKYRVVERKGIKNILQEQDFGGSNRTKQGTTARIGKIQGADAILMATITVFGRDDKKTNVGAGALAPGLLGAVSWGKKEDKAVVAVAYRLVDAETSEVISSGEARGESLRKSKGLAIAGAGTGGGGVGGFDMTSSNFAETIVGEATIDCMNKLIEILNGNESKIRLRQVELDTRVADVAGKQVYISSGSAESVQKCDRFEVSRILKEVKDPVTKEVLDLQLEKVGELMITEVRDKMAIGAFQGTQVPEVGMAVRKILPAPPSVPAATAKQ